MTLHINDLARNLAAAAHNQRGPLIDAAAAFLGWSRDKIYRELKSRAGWQSGRKTRADKGSTCQPLESMQLIAGMQKAAVRKNGKVTMHMPTALSLASVNGQAVNVSAGRMNRLLSDRSLSVRQQKQPTPHAHMASQHPNHVHQVDPSLCLLYYLKNGQQGMMREDEFYKNKPENVERIENYRVWRYVLYDHASGAVIPWYVQARGESQENLFAFLMFAWGQQPERPFHGVPNILVWDKGSANTSHAIKNLLTALQVEQIPHTAHNPRAKGGVENANNLVEIHFECRLRFQPVANVDELNLAAALWANAWNANLIPRQDTRLKRRGMIAFRARFDLWLTIKKEQLRLLPEVAVCRLLLEGKAITRKVHPGMEIHYKHPQAGCSGTYDVSGLDCVRIGDQLDISPLVYGAAAILIRVQRFDGAPLEYVLEPVVFDPVFGFRADAAIWGESYKAQPDTAIETQSKHLDRQAFPGLDAEEIRKAKDKNTTPYKGQLDTLTHLRDINMPAYLARRGSELNVPNRMQVETPVLTHTAACKRLVAELQRPLTSAEHSEIRQAWPDGVPDAEIAALSARLASSATPDNVVQFALGAAS